VVCAVAGTKESGFSQAVSRGRLPLEEGGFLGFVI